jgi:TolB protein
LQVSDTDGYNPQTLLTSDEPIMSPAWSPDGSELAYVSFESGQAEIFTQNIFTGVRKSRSKFKGLNGAPAWSPDGKKLAITLSKDGNPDIYILNLADNKLQRLTDHWSIDTEAVWLPDGKSIIYTSSRSGKPQLYQQSVTTKAAPERLTYEGNYNASASVSADGKSVAYVHGEGNIYRIAVLELATKSSRILTDGPLDESPVYAPNNSMILFASQEKNEAVLAAVSVDGRQRQRLAFTNGEVREPSWAAVRH